MNIYRNHRFIIMYQLLLVFSDEIVFLLRMTLRLLGNISWVEGNLKKIKIKKTNVYSTRFFDGNREKEMSILRGSSRP